MDDKTKAVIKSVLSTLDTIKVSGRQDINRMLGCMMALTQLIQEENKKE